VVAQARRRRDGTPLDPGRARHPVHHLAHGSAGALAEWDVPVGIGTLITVDTTIPADIAVVAAQVRRHHAPR
jgi:hypothetical protein